MFKHTKDSQMTASELMRPSHSNFNEKFMEVIFLKHSEKNQNL